MKKIAFFVVLLILFVHLAYSQTTYCKTKILDNGEAIKTNCCDYDTNERDANEQNCIDCGHYWYEDRCCDDDGDFFCDVGGGSCVDGESYRNHCLDERQNCDETGIDCGGTCGPCCSFSSADGFCPTKCSLDEDFDCCAEINNQGVVGWSDMHGCCGPGRTWCDGASSCIGGKYFIDHCSNGVRDCDEEGPDCGGTCGPCELVMDGQCTLFDLMIFKQKDPDCCERLGGIFADGRCCYAGGQNWCSSGGGSCIDGVYTQDHCQDGVLNNFCYNKVVSFNMDWGVYESFYTGFTSENGIDCGGDCGSC